jgi:Flp pilus assembly protein TadB
MIGALLFGALVGAGAYGFVRVWLRPEPGVATLVARIDSGARSMRTHTATDAEIDGGVAGGVQATMVRLGDRLEVLVADRGWQLGKVRSDLGMTNRTLGGFLATKLVLGVFLLMVAPVLWAVMEVAGVPVAGAIPALGALVLGALGFYLPDLALRSEAASRRRDFRRVVGILLDLVAMNLAGGRGLPEALLSASTISEQWSVVRIRQALANARLFGTTPWAALGDLGAEIGVDELRDLSAALSLAADDGAKIRTSLSARAATLRRRELAEAEGEAGEKSQSMLIAQLVLCMGFLLFLGYPAVAQLLAQ